MNYETLVRYYERLHESLITYTTYPAVVFAECNIMLRELEANLDHWDETNDAHRRLVATIKRHRDIANYRR